MKVYTAHLRPARNPVLVREGWCWGAALFGPLWLLACGAWIAATFFFAASVWILSLVPVPLWWLAGLGLALLHGLLGRDVYRWSLSRRGYALAHVLAARDEDAALARLYAARQDLIEAAR